MDVDARPWWPLALAAAVPVALGVMLVACLGRPGAIQLQYTAAVPADVRALAVATLTATTAAVPARRGCLTGATVDADRELDERARYMPTSATIVLRIPATAGQLESALIHELAHHIEYTCPDHRGLRAGFLLAQDLPASAAWTAGPTWEQTPSEQYAEALVQLVRGRRSFHRQVPISDGAIAVLRAWGHGRGATHPAPTPVPTP